MDIATFIGMVKANGTVKVNGAFSTMTGKVDPEALDEAFESILELPDLEYHFAGQLKNKYLDRKAGFYWHDPVLDIGGGFEI